MNIIESIKIAFYKKFKCPKNKHYHPENDGIYLSKISHGRCYACGKLIQKTSKGWVLDTDFEIGDEHEI